ncbi:hypothetical protein A7985_13320 [Pseudoalteromonas luteoviolacea]|uniref:Uncharacterized protein n=1 Tax=Pseudoalteromonas luteoviolacea TaxID=43657 RepID=A0A1C0TPV9_9GAMM|nr:hypothetical protein [Pseudoalteromonas luteoviolacea]MBQ4811733.1 hypothetical protein [Pseudoalteromonas luteoviolacea]OCQ20778.1 hypothetical protein A7985_13320 [Pseudoalteromonas luteoviolacea]
MKNTLYILPFALTCAAASIQVSATEQYESCNAILAHNALNAYENTMFFKTKIALKKWVCSSDFSSDDSARNLAKDAARIFSVDGHVGGLNNWKNNNCSEDDKSYQGSKATHALIQSVSLSTVNAWSQCMQQVNNTPLTCHATQVNDLLVVNIDAQSVDGQLVDVTTYTNNLTLELSDPAAAESTVIEPGKLSIKYRLNDKNSGAYFELNGQDNSQPVSCSYEIPTPATLDPEACEVFRKQSFLQGKISAREYDYMKEHDKVPVFDFENGRFIAMYSCKDFL